jgi:DNA-binding beta-propeller fold protein YncE
MTKPQEYIKSLPAFRKKQCLQLLQDLNNVNHKVKDLQFTIEELRGKLRTPDDAKIEIVQNLFPPTRIQLKDSIVKIEKKESHTTFRVPPGRAEIEVIYS